MMNCNDVQDKLSGYRDGRLSAQMRWNIRLHLKDCHACRQAAQSLGEVCALLDAPPSAPSLPEGFSERLLAQARQTASAQGSGSGRGKDLLGRWSYRVAAAAVIVVGVGSGLWLSDLSHTRSPATSTSAHSCEDTNYFDGSFSTAPTDLYRGVDALSRC